MYFLFFFTLPIAIVVIPGAFSISPGDPFPTNLDEKPGVPLLSDPEDVYNKKMASSIYLPSIKSDSIHQYIPEKKFSLIDVNKTVINKNKDNNLQSSSTLKPVQEKFLIYKKHFIQIGQWQYTTPKTRQTRYWYHTTDSEMGADWTFDSILCQAYSRQKPNTVPIHVFHSETKDTWTNTLQLESTPLPIGNNQWKYDGTPFYAYKTSMNSTLLKPVWRYWNKINYGTEDVSEPRRSYLRMGDIVDDDLPGWRLDRILFYAFLPDMNVTQLEN